MDQRTKAYLQLENAPAIDGLAFRNYRGEEDLAAMIPVFDACNQADGIRETTTLEFLVHLYRNLTNCDPAKDMIFAEVNGRVIAYSRVWWGDEPDGPLTYYTFCYLHPDWRRKGIGGAILRHNRARIREIAAGHDPERKKLIYTWAEEKQAGAHALLKREGFEEVRYFFTMLRDLNRPIPEPVMPEGLAIRPVTPQNLRQVWEAQEEAFRDHWGYTQQTEVDFQRLVDAPDLNLSLWKVGWDGDEVAGVIRNEIKPGENAKLGVEWGRTEPISVRRPWRKRGLATALLNASLLELKAQGMQHAVLGVDTQNPNGALQLYQNAGYEVTEKYTDYKKDLIV
jgi:GNAT superfamily N-acetyltransferase